MWTVLTVQDTLRCTTLLWMATSKQFYYSASYLKGCPCVLLYIKNKYGERACAIEFLYSQVLCSCLRDRTGQWCSTIPPSGQEVKNTRLWWNCTGIFCRMQLVRFKIWLGCLGYLEHTFIFNHKWWTPIVVELIQKVISPGTEPRRILLVYVC